tara:strand:- start:3160 stop:3462 length:303 start_codon:yes stop_codon:yes gene_type:complete
MKLLTVKSSFEISGNGLKYILPIGSKVSFVKETYHFYHAYYESHNYKALVEYKGKELELRVHRVHGSKTFKLLSCKPTHSDKNKAYWKDLFEEECPLKIR